ncbi:hypothetical protein [Paracnuella aquatica]|uniref:hypothetical protein n=1 Tax=Paracnuella aquatica TaxID=2268757 RepID=UPI000DEEF281|nr:hypothetical protein [Paracnuella aquatica]RPD43445.1 hypothetical protein DRJ53_20125 [Paracnuella aquatica]
MKTLPLLTLLLLLSCNNLSGHIEQQVDSKVATAKQDMNSEVEKAELDFIAAYQIAKKRDGDKLQLQNLQTFKTTIASADDYMDSLKTEMDKLDEMDVQNVEQVQSTFLYKGVGDSIINKLNRILAAAQVVARTEEQKVAIKVMSDSLGMEPNPDAWKEQVFGLTNPLDVSMVLYGLRIELYRIGMKALAD